ncbi:MAG TPA: LCCL domain-containing protein [Pyrinomonadaceae bacterium]|nr:LCCL domain-containing protein [Pyrinomonadaceae bacterium]
MSPSQQKTQSLLGRERRITCACVVLLLAAAFGIAGCSKLKHDNAGGGGHAAPDTSSPTSAAAPPSSAGNGTPTTWQANAASLAGKPGQTFTLSCSPGGAAGSVWGSDIYTADSSICTAAVHSGLINFQQGGTVTIELRPSRPIFGCSERNGVTSSPYGFYGSSFVFQTPNTEALVREADDQTPVLWNTPATIVGGENGKTHKFKCPSNGAEGMVWGSDIYTIDSSICNAGAHAGKFTRESGGSVTIELRPGESAYKGTTRNGIKTNDYGAYGRSFVVK